MPKRRKQIDDIEQVDTPVEENTDVKVTIAQSITNTIRSSKIIQLGILAILMALSIAIVQGNIASLFGIKFKEEAPIVKTQETPQTKE